MASKRIGAMWLKKNEKGHMLSGEIDLGAAGKARFVAFPNDRKEKDNQPDYNMVLSEDREESKAQTVDTFGFGQEESKVRNYPTQPTQTGSNPVEEWNQSVPEGYPTDEINPEDIPFN